MYANFDGLLGVMMAFLFLSAIVFLLIVAHVVWVVTVYRFDTRAGRPAWLKIIRMLIVAMTPIVSFYVVKFSRWPPAPVDEKPQRIRYLLPLVAPLIIVAMTCIAQSSYGPYVNQSLWSSSWTGFAEMFGKLFAGYLVIHACLYMFAQVIGGSQHSVWTTLTHLVTLFMWGIPLLLLMLT